MKKSTYDTISTISVVALVVFTIGAQHSSRFGYVFGVLAVLSAVGLFGAYIKGLRAGTSTDQSTQNTEVVRQSENAAQMEALERNVREDLYRKILHIEWHQAALAHEASHLRLSERRFQLSLKAVELGRPNVKAGSYYTHVRFHRDPVRDDPASIITNIIEKLCAASKEPRFEFILGPDGSFKIQQISAKRATVVGTSITPQEQPVEPSAEADEPQLIN